MENDGPPAILVNEFLIFERMSRGFCVAEQANFTFGCTRWYHLVPIHRPMSFLMLA